MQWAEIIPVENPIKDTRIKTMHTNFRYTSHKTKEKIISPDKVLYFWSGRVGTGDNIYVSNNQVKVLLGYIPN